nr:hypothetical protein [Tanacetum cinerariifolium]
MKMEHYFSHKEYPIWQVIQNGNGLVCVTTDTNGMIKVFPPKTVEEVVARERERKVRTTLLMALPEDHLAKFHKMADANEIWEAIISRFGDNDESKKMQKYLLKQQFEGFSMSASEGLHKGYDSFDDLYNNLRVFERDVKGTTASSSSNTQNVAFVSTDNTSSTNDISTAYSVSSPSINDDDLEEMALKWQVAMIFMRIKKFHKRTGTKLQFDIRDTVGFNKTKVDASITIKWGILLETAELKGIKTVEDEMVGTMETKLETMVEDLRIKMIQKLWLPLMERLLTESYDGLNKLYNEQRDKLGDASVEITAYTLALKKGNYMPSGPDVEIDYSKFTYGPKQTSADELDSKPVEYASSHSDSSVEPSTSVPEPVVNVSNIVNEPKVVYEPKVWTDAPIIEEYESDSDDDLVFNVQENIEKPSFAFTDSIKHVKSLRENVKETGTPNHYPKIEKQDRHNHTRKGLGYGRKSCFVCSSFSHLIRDCDFHGRRTAKQAALTKSKEKGTSQQAHRPVWNNVQRVNHQNKFVPSAVLTKTGKIPVNAARQNFSWQAALTSIASKVNTAKPFVNETRPTRCFYKSHSPHQRPFHNKTAQRNTFANHKVNTINISLSVVKGNEDTAVKASAGIKRKYSNAITPQQNGVTERKNMTLIEAARTILADSFLPTIFLAEAINTACYVLNRVLVTKPQNKTPYELLTGRQPIISYLRPFGCHVTILNTIDQLGKFDGKYDSGFLVGYSLNSKAFRIYNIETKRVEENLHSAFMYGTIDEEVYVTQPPGFVDLKFPNKDETTPILKDFKRQAKNQFNHKVKTIRSDNGIEFKNNELIEFCGLKGIKREYNNARTLQQNRVVERKNMFLIEAARTMLADSFLPTTFWVEVVNTACYVLNRILVTKPKNKIAYELLTGKQPIISYLRLFGCHVTILNTIDQLGKFDGKSDSEFLVGYFVNSKAFRLYNLETKRVEENLHVNFLENKLNVVGKGHIWIFDLDYLTNSMNYEYVSLKNQANKSAGPQEANNSAGTQANDDQGTTSEAINLHDEHFVLPIWSPYSTTVKSSKDKIQKTTNCKISKKPVNQVEHIFQEELEKLKRKEKDANDAVWKEATHETQDVNTDNTNLFNTVSAPVSAVGPSRALNNDEPSYPDDPLMPHHEDIYVSPSAGIFTDSSYDDDGLPFGKKAIRTKWVYRNKKGERGVLVRNKARLVVQGHGQEEGIDYDKVFALVATIEAIRIFLAFASYMGFIVYQINVKSALLYGTIDEEVYVTQPPRFVDLKFPNKVYKVVKALYGLHQAPRACVKTASTPIKTQKPLVKDEEAVDVDVTPKTSHLQAMKRIFRYLKGQPKLGLWYPKVSLFNMEAYSDSDYAGANLDKKSTTRGCQFLRRRHISWQCKKQNIVATSTTEAEYVVVAHCYG